METSRPRENWNQPQPPQPHYQESKKILAGIMGILFGGLGIHKFVLGYTNEGIILLALSIIGVATSCFFIGIFIAGIAGLIGFIEGIIYLTKTDQEFYQTYQVNKRPWF
ncbi:MAG: TM2 domain-containing protein [Flavobacterium sp.]